MPCRLHRRRVSWRSDASEVLLRGPSQRGSIQGMVLAIDRSAKGIAQARAASADEIGSGRMSVHQVAAESFVFEGDEAPFDVVFAVLVGELDGRHPAAGRQAMQRIAAALAPGGRLFVDGCQPLRELSIAT